MSESESRFYRFKQWLADVPLISLALLKLCSAGGSVVYAEWRWKRCPKGRG